MLASAAPGDWVVTYSDPEDSTYLTSIIGKDVTKPALLGGLLNNPDGAWYYLGNGLQAVATTTGSGNHYELRIDWAGLDTSAITAPYLLTSVFNSAMATMTATVSPMLTFTDGIKSTMNGSTTTALATNSANEAGLVTKAQAQKIDALPSSFTQTQADWNQASTTAVDYIKNKPTIGKAYEGTTARSGAFPVFKNATVSGGTAVFYLTTDGTANGTALFPNGIISDSIDVEVNDATASYQMSYALSNGNKTLTVTANKLTTANILTGLLGQAQANGSVVRLQAWGY